MKNIIATLIFVFFTALSVASTTDSLFLKMPNQLLPTLSYKQRFELAEYFKASKTDSVPNLFGRNTILLVYDTVQQHIVVKTSATGTTEIKKISLPDNTLLIAVIQTVNLPVKISSIKFFTTDWQPYPLQLKLPEATEWVDEKKQILLGISPAWIENLLLKSCFSMNFNAKNELVVENNVLSTLSTEDRKLLETIYENKKISVSIQK